MIIVAGVKPPIEFLSTPKVCERNLDSIEKAIRGAQVPTWRKPNMQLRDHPLMTYRGNRSWPPAWLWTAGYETTHPQGEVGLLKAILRSHIQPHDRCFLIMDHCGAEYVGALLLSDPVFCAEIIQVLMQHCGETVQEIGDIDLSYTL